MLYLRSNSTLTPKLLEGLIYGDMGLMGVPKAIYDGAFVYFSAVPITYFMQVYLLGADIHVHIPSVLEDCTSW